MDTFDEIYILNLHGDTRKNEVAPDGGKDENVFDIMQGVSINIFVKKGRHFGADGDRIQSLAKVYHYEIFGKRFEKYAFLAKKSFSDIPWYELTPQAPQYFFVPKDFSVQEEYEKGFKVDDLMKVRNSGVKTDRDLLFYDCDKDCLIERISSLLSGKQLEKNFIELYNVVDSSSYKITDKIKCCKFDNSKIQKAEYRVLDFYYIYYDEKLVSRAAFNVMQHLRKANVALVVPRQCSSDWKYVFCTNTIGDHNLIASAGKLGAGDLFPLYLYPTDGEEQLGETRKPNLDEKIWRKIDKCTKLETTPEQIFDYIYGVLHTPSYREKYKEFLKIDFPRIPFPENKEEFERVVSIGNKLRKLHLMEEIPPQQTSFDIEGDNTVSEIRFEKEIPDQVGEDIGGKVYINKTQYFANVPELAWNFYIGGYQPAQKWLKDRKNRTLTYDDMSHYRKIIAILIETHKLMQNLDNN